MIYSDIIHGCVIMERPFTSKIWIGGLNFTLIRHGDKYRAELYDSVGRMIVVGLLDTNGGECCCCSWIFLRSLALSDNLNGPLI